MSLNISDRCFTNGLLTGHSVIPGGDRYIFSAKHTDLQLKHFLNTNICVFHSIENSWQIGAYEEVDMLEENECKEHLRSNVKEHYKEILCSENIERITNVIYLKSIIIKCQ